MAKVETLKTFIPGRGYTREDWDDVTSPETTEAEWATARPAAEALPSEFFSWLEAARTRRGRPSLEKPKRSVTIRLDADLLEHFKAGGKGWQSRVNEALRKASGLDA